MRNECVAVLDIRSYSVTFLMGSKGVNGTFVCYDSKSENYDGYYTDGFNNKTSFKRAVTSVISSVRQNYKGAINEIYVGVPAAFTKILTKGHTISFPSKRKISSLDVDMLYDRGLNELLSTGKLIRRSEMYLTLADNRKYFNEKALYGISSASLKGGLCYYFIEDAFHQDMLLLLQELGVEKINFIPASLAQAMYLLPQKRREGYAILLDIGHLNSSVSVVYGNGIVHQQSFDIGLGNILSDLMQKLAVDYEKAQEILFSANISGTVAKGEIWKSKDGEQYSVLDINETIKCTLDGLCEKMDGFFGRYYQDKRSDLHGSVISITGEGAIISGMDKHITNRTNRFTEIVYPDVPFFDKSIFSSRISVLEMALNDCKKQSLLYRIFNFFGGRKK